jgi:beta-1,4-N-acetylglucosaminyltransferase
MAYPFIEIWIQGTLRGWSTLIFVTVGMHHQGFDRLIKAMDELADLADESVVMQIGASKYEPVHCKWFRFDSQEKADALCAEARVIVGHAGAGTIICAMHCDRPIVVVPRRVGYNEGIDDHQIELASALAAQNKVILVSEPTVPGLLDGIQKATLLVTQKKDRGHLAEAIQEILETRHSTGLVSSNGSE